MRRWPLGLTVILCWGCGKGTPEAPAPPVGTAFYTNESGRKIAFHVEAGNQISGRSLMRPSAPGPASEPLTYVPGGPPSFWLGVIEDASEEDNPMHDPIGYVMIPVPADKTFEVHFTATKDGLRAECAGIVRFSKYLEPEQNPPH